MEKKTADIAAVVQMDPPDLKRLQLLLQGSISAQVNQGVQEYCIFLTEPLLPSLPETDTDRLKQVYRYGQELVSENTARGSVSPSPG